MAIGNFRFPFFGGRSVLPKLRVVVAPGEDPFPRPAFDVIGELAPGVVRLRSGAQTLIIKPGSYPWPQSVWENE